MSSSVLSFVMTLKSLIDASTISMDHKPTAHTGELIPSPMGVQSKQAISFSNVLLAKRTILPFATFKQCNCPPAAATRI